MTTARHVFAGGHTPRGYVSFHHHILPSDRAKHIYILRGIAGAGTSSFLRRMGEALEAEGLAVEYHHRPADSAMLHAVVLPGAGVALIDGEAPHAVEPALPGAAGTLLDFVRFFDEPAARAQREKIAEAATRIEACVQRGYRYLAAARSVHDDIEAVNGGLLDLGALNQMADSLIGELFGGRLPASKPGRARRLFATAFAGDGHRNFLDSIAGPAAYKVVVRGQPGTGKSTLIGKIAAAALERGLDVEAFHCPFDPEKMEHLVIPALDLAVTTSANPHEWSGPADLELNADEALDETGQAKDAAVVAQARETCRHLLEYAAAAFAGAKRWRDELEALCAPFMNAAPVDEEFESLKAAILEAARVVQ